MSNLFNTNHLDIAVQLSKDSDIQKIGYCCPLEYCSPCKYYPCTPWISDSTPLDFRFLSLDSRFPLLELRILDSRSVVDFGFQKIGFHCLDSRLQSYFIKSRILDYLTWGDAYKYTLQKVLD